MDLKTNEKPQLYLTISSPPLSCGAQIINRSHPPIRGVVYAEAIDAVIDTLLANHTHIKSPICICTSRYAKCLLSGLSSEAIM